GPLDVAAREAALRAVEMEEDPLYPHTSLPPGVLDERRQKFAKVVLVVVAGSALLVALAFLLGRGRGDRTLSSTESNQLSAPAVTPETERHSFEPGPDET